jgi:hypothetical protein
MSHDVSVAIRLQKLGEASHRMVATIVFACIVAGCMS